MTDSSLAKQLQAAFPQLDFKSNFPLAPLAYFKLGGPAEVYVTIDTVEQLAELRKYCYQNTIKTTLWGGASNVVVADEGIQGLVIHLTNNQVEVLEEKVGDKQIVRVGAGIKTALLVRKVIDLGYQGLEYFLGVPGTLGGAVYNNAHYLQHLIGDYVHRVQVISPNGGITWLSHEEADFGYDHSRFQTSQEIIFTVEFSLLPGNKEASMAKVKEATQYRAQTQPLGEPSSGCIFQNVPNTDQLRAQFPQFADKPFVPGGFLIDQAGLKGAKSGAIEVSQKHAAFFVNKGQGTAADVKKLVEHVKSTVKEKFNADLQEEVFYLS